MESDPKRPPSQGEKTPPLRGWLLFWALVLVLNVVFSPIALALNWAAYFRATEGTETGIPGSFLAVDLIASILLWAYVCCVAVAFFERRQVAVTMLIVMLALQFLSKAILGTLVPAFLLEEPVGVVEWVKLGFLAMWFIGWAAYFARSRRVQEVFIVPGQPLSKRPFVRQTRAKMGGSLAEHSHVDVPEVPLNSSPQGSNGAARPVLQPSINQTESMTVDQYSVSVPEGHQNQEGYVIMRHGTQYSLMLENHSARRCDAEVKIDGGVVGVWRVDARSAIRVDRPVHDTGIFTFFEIGTVEAKKAGVSRGDETGLISVTFYPECNLQPLCTAQRPTMGGTGLTGESEQRFVTASRIERSEAEAVTIHLRLIAIQESPRPLFPRSNPIPPPVGP